MSAVKGCCTLGSHVQNILQSTIASVMLAAYSHSAADSPKKLD